MKENEGVRKIKGISFNKWAGMGIVIGDPVFTQDQDKRYAFMTLRTEVPEVGANGQWTTQIIDVPLITLNQSTSNTVEKYVKDGKELYIEGYFKSWQDGQTTRFGMFVTNLKLGSGPFKPKNVAEV